MHTIKSGSNLKILTFDLEDWFRIYSKPDHSTLEEWGHHSHSIEKDTERICQFLENKNIKATFFCLGREAGKYPGLVRNISDSGHEIGAHSFNHFKLNNLNEKEFREDTSRVVKKLEDITGKKVKAYRAPGLSVNKRTLWAFETLIDLGIEADSSLVTGQLIGKQKVPGYPFILDYKGVKIKEFPISSFPIFRHSFNFAGSGFFRISPYWFLHKKMIKSSYIVSYFHPRDFDVDIHKSIQNNLYLKLKYRFGARNAFQKLKKLSESTPWVSMDKALLQINWEDAKTVSFI